jgi:hypothetical protein
MSLRIKIAPSRPAKIGLFLFMRFYPEISGFIADTRQIITSGIIPQFD